MLKKKKTYKEALTGKEFRLDPSKEPSLHQKQNLKTQGEQLSKFVQINLQQSKPELPVSESTTSDDTSSSEIQKQSYGNLGSWHH